MTRSALLGLAFLLWFGTPAQSDTLLIESIQEMPPNHSGGLLRPTGGMTMKQVKASFGAPRQEIPWVGLPPISRWVYDGYTVYFEDNLVIHSTVHR